MAKHGKVEWGEKCHYAIDILFDWSRTFYCHIIFYWEKVIFLRNLVTILPLKSKFSGKFQRFNATDGYIEMLKNSWISISIKTKNSKTSYEAQIMSRFKKIIQPPPTPSHQIKSYYVFETKIFLGRFTELYRDFLSKWYKNAVFGRQEMVQCKCFYWHQTETFLLENL